jgi:hypothetical protein
MSIGETTTRLTSSRPRLEHRRPDLAVSVAARLLVLGEPGVDLRHELRVADAQVVVRDPAAAGHDVERELSRVLRGVLCQVLEPLQAGLRGPLGRHHDRSALRLVCGQCRIQTRLFA